MSEHLPWGQTVENPHTLWKTHTYPSEPKVIGEIEWFQGFLRKLAEKALKERCTK